MGCHLHLLLRWRLCRTCSKERETETETGHSVQGKTASLIEVFLSNMRYVLNLEDGIELIFGLPKRGLFEVDTDEWESMRICSEYCFIFL